MAANDPLGVCRAASRGDRRRERRSASGRRANVQDDGPRGLPRGVSPRTRHEAVSQCHLHWARQGTSATEAVAPSTSRGLSGRVPLCVCVCRQQL